ncbi:spermidine/putrescine ABC transporter substrate-binding protein [Streptomyces sp. NPDC007945]|uniref:polyamine ABC transporter substrate-binding protein n=1 Tax=Streptomyces sp. NPDC007945 TaxID=3364797 RepID=UPI0036E501FA
MTRRSVLTGLAAAGASGLLAACGVKPAHVPEDRRAARDLSDRERTVTFANWPLYIDTDDDDPRRRPSLDAFRERTGISVHYTEEINDNDEFFGKIGPALMNGQAVDRDLVVVSDWMAARLVRLGWVQKMDRAAQPNVVGHLDPQLLRPAFDPGRLHSVPWQSGITGIAYNRRGLGRELRSTRQLWDADLRGKVTLLSGLDEAVPLLMQGDGADVTRWTQDDFHAVCDRVEDLVRRKHIRRFTGNDYIKDLAAGDVLACQAYSGDVVQLQADDPDIAFVVPEEGGELWAESLLVPNLARHKANAEKLVDHYYEPEVAARLAAWVNYVCPVPAAQAVLADSGDEELAALAEDPLIFPDREMRGRLAIARDITSGERKAMAARWNGLVGL